MGKQHNKDLLKFLEPFAPDIRQKALWLRDLVWDMYPQANELIYDGYNALAFGWGLSDRLGDVFCSVAVYGKGVNFGFNRGNELHDNEQMLLGNGSMYRYLKVNSRQDFPLRYVTLLLAEAHACALSRYKPGKKACTGQTIVKSVSDKKRRPA